MINTKSNFTGLSENEVIQFRKTSGSNSLDHQQKNHFLLSLIDMVQEPMFLLLIAATTIYFITGEYSNGIFMAVAIYLTIATGFDYFRKALKK
jgi:Ca2+-transporting ATPase